MDDGLMTAHLNPDQLPYDENKFPPVFLKAYLNYQKSQSGNVLIVGDERQTFVPIVLRKKYGFKIGRFLYKPYNAKAELNDSEERIFLENLKSFLSSNNLADVLLSPQHICVFHGLPMSALAAPLGIISVDFKNKSEEDIFSNFQPRYRTVIRKAERDKVQIEFGIKHFGEFFRLYQETQKRENAIGDSRVDIKKMVEFIGDDHIQCGVAYVNGHADSALFNIYNPVEAYYLYGGTKSPTLHEGSFKLLQWEAMKQLLHKNVARYCLGGARRGNIDGTKFQRIIEFKTRFGASIEEGYHIILPVTAKYGLYNNLMKLNLRIKGIKDQQESMPFKPVASYQ